MIETPNAIFLHLPKTGGTWVSQILKPIVTNDNYPYFSEARFLSEIVSPKNKKVFTFVRNPWDWHKSFYLHTTSGTEITTDEDTHGLLRNYLLIQNKNLPSNYAENPSFSEFIKAFTSNPPKSVIEKASKISNVRTLMRNQRIKDPYAGNFCFNLWKEHEKPFYQNICNMFTKNADYVGRYENLRFDLIEILDMVGDLTAEVEDKIMELPRLNYTQTINYREMYDSDTKEIIQNTCQEMIGKYDYKF
jgi:hypothetical protein